MNKELEERKKSMIHSCKNTTSQVKYLEEYIDGLLRTAASKDKAMSMGIGQLINILDKHGIPDLAWEIMMNMVNTLGEGMPGTISEVLPDEGCFTQFWSGYLSCLQGKRQGRR